MRMLSYLLGGMLADVRFTTLTPGFSAAHHLILPHHHGRVAPYHARAATWLPAGRVVAAAMIMATKTEIRRFMVSAYGKSAATA